VITHGWPSTFFEMSKIIPLLADPGSHGGDPADAFDVVAPSLPGFGFSQASKERGMEIGGVADLWTKLMTENLGYPKFVAVGGDIGAGVTSRLGYSHADVLHGIHLTSVTRPTPYLGPDARPLTAAEEAHSAQREKWFQDEGGYNHLQGTKPQTLSYGLNDSPAGVCAWIVEKWRTWSDCNGDVESSYTKDELLTTVTIYWVTQTIGSSVRMYRENQTHVWELEQEERVGAPAGMAMFPQEIARPPREWAERSYDVRRWQEMPRGGHFAAFEEPGLLAHEVREFFRQFR
jgi:pimeloyl-ACP methyl ester carboxylesterase